MPIRSLPAARIGILAGLTGILRRVGLTVLALLGVISAGTAFPWATDFWFAWVAFQSDTALTD